jgi:hypothetical protein
LIHRRSAMNEPLDGLFNEELVRRSFETLTNDEHYKPKKKGSKIFQSLKLKKHIAANKKFHKLFKEKFPSESTFTDRDLINEFSCALLRNKSLLLHGTMYTTKKYFAFHSNIFGYETYLIKRWAEVTQLKKENIALVFPTAISLTTHDESYFFASFMARNQAFKAFYKLWNNQFFTITKIYKEYQNIRRNSTLCFEIINNVQQQQEAESAATNVVQKAQSMNELNVKTNETETFDESIFNEKKFSGKI